MESAVAMPRLKGEHMSKHKVCDRRTFLAAAIGGATAASAFAQARGQQQSAQQPSAQQPSVSSTSSPRDYSRLDPIQYPDPDIVPLDDRFRRYIVGNTVIRRLHFGTFWAEGPAWNGVGRYLVWSDIPNNVQMRWIEEDGRVTAFRNPSGYSNGNTFDYEGRQLSCEHGGRRVVRYEFNGSVTVIAETFEGKHLNSPNDIVVHPDGSVWFTDPPYGILGNYEGFPATPELKEAVYRVDPKTAKIDKVTDELDKPNGLCFSPDYKTLYICDPGPPRDIEVFDVADGRLRNKRQFANMKMSTRENIN